MSMVSALQNGIFRRQRDRLQSERVATSPSEEDEEGAFITADANEEESSIIEDTNEEVDLEAAEEVEEDTEESESHNSVGVNRFTVRPTMTLAELEEEREVVRRRSSACILFALFILLRLWLLAFEEADVGLILVCLVGSSWAYRWIRYNRDQEAELDRRIAQYLEGNGNAQVGRDDIRMLSFQAQLALAIMESQRQMMQGGYGHPDGDGNQQNGVGEEARAKWNIFAYKEMRDKEESLNGSSYGSLKQQEEDNSEEEPHCSICLGEYEEGEQLCKLPCGHIYHADCVSAWCTNHTRCPLCNLDLEAGAEA